MNAELDQCIRLLADLLGHNIEAPTRVRRDPHWKKHRRDLLEGIYCHASGCQLRAADGDWCWTHSPDEVAIERAMQGLPVPLMPHERAEAARRLAARGINGSKVLGMSGSSYARAVAS